MITYFDNLILFSRYNSHNLGFYSFLLKHKILELLPVDAAEFGSTGQANYRGTFVNRTLLDGIFVLAGSWHVGVPVLAVVGPLFVFTKANRGLRPYGGQLLPSDRGGQDVFPWANAVGVLSNVRALRCLSKGHPSRRALFTLYLLSRGLGPCVF